VAEVLPTQSRSTDECAPDDVADWLLARQVGWDAVAESAFDDKPLDRIWLIQAVWRDLEEFPRPACADDLYILTVYIYDNLVDGDTITIAGRDQDVASISASRVVGLRERVEARFDELEDIAGTDVEAMSAGTYAR
jgi:hypothetical protein